MALKVIDAVEVMAGVINRLKEAEIEAYDSVPDNTKAPFCFVEPVKVEPKDTKLSMINNYIFWIHVFAEDTGSEPILELTNNINEALTEDIYIGLEFSLISQVNKGIITIKREPETAEKHAIIELHVQVCYGYKVKI